jgi:hypothetical protein
VSLTVASRIPPALIHRSDSGVVLGGFEARERRAMVHPGRARLPHAPLFPRTPRPARPPLARTPTSSSSYTTRPRPWRRSSRWRRGRRSGADRSAAPAPRSLRRASLAARRMIPPADGRRSRRSCGYFGRSAVGWRSADCRIGEDHIRRRRPPQTMRLSPGRRLALTRFGGHSPPERARSAARASGSRSGTRAQPCQPSAS